MSDQIIGTASIRDQEGLWECGSGGSCGGGGIVVRRWLGCGGGSSGRGSIVVRRWLGCGGRGSIVVRMWWKIGGGSSGGESGEGVREVDKERREKGVLEE